jgi:hypothetical protein
MLKDDSGVICYKMTPKWVRLFFFLYNEIISPTGALSAKMFRKISSERFEDVYFKKMY